MQALLEIAQHPSIHNEGLDSLDSTHSVSVRIRPAVQHMRKMQEGKSSDCLSTLDSLLASPHSRQALRTNSHHATQ